MFKKIVYLTIILVIFSSANAVTNYYTQNICSATLHESYFKQNQIDLENFRDEEDNTALHLALKNGENSFAEEILEQYPQLINIENSNNESPIYIADKYENREGVKLCLEYQPMAGSIDNNCYQIFEKVKGTKPYYLNKNISEFYQPENRENIDKLVIMLDFTDVFNDVSTGSALLNHFKKSAAPILVIGNAKHSLNYESIKKAIEEIELPEKIIVIINAHGIINKKTGDHEISFDNTHYKPKTKDLFVAIKSIFKSKPIDLLMLACHGGGAIKDVDLLPKNSNLLVLAQEDRIVMSTDYTPMFHTPAGGGGSLPLISNYQKHPEEFSLQHLLISYLFSIKHTNNIPELAVSGGKKEFDYRDLGKYLGHKLNDMQKIMILNELKPHCAIRELPNKGFLTSLSRWGKTDCENDILSAIAKIETARNIDDLKAPETLSYDQSKSYFFQPVGYQKDEPCSAKSINQFLKESSEEEIKTEILSGTVTDFFLCNMFRPPDPCDLIKPEKPLFGIALAVLYTIKKLAI